MPKGNPFGYAAKKMKKRSKLRGTAGGNKSEKKVMVKKMKTHMKNMGYG